MKTKVKLKDKTKNQINILHIFKENGVWMFNDEEVGLYKEPFVSSINPMIDRVVDGDKFKAFISHSSIFEFTMVLDKENEGMDGTYKLRGTDIIGWLCPATLKYFDKYPDSIYVKIEQ